MYNTLSPNTKNCGLTESVPNQLSVRMGCGSKNINKLHAYENIFMIIL